MQEKFVNAIKTQVATKVSTKTKVLLGLIIVASLSGMFALIGLSSKTLLKQNVVRKTNSNMTVNDEIVKVNRIDTGKIQNNLLNKYVYTETEKIETREINIPYNDIVLGISYGTNNDHIPTMDGIINDWEQENTTIRHSLPGSNNFSHDIYSKLVDNKIYLAVKASGYADVCDIKKFPYMQIINFNVKLEEGHNTFYGSGSLDYANNAHQEDLKMVHLDLNFNDGQTYLCDGYLAETDDQNNFNYWKAMCSTYMPEQIDFRGGVTLYQNNDLCVISGEMLIPLKGQDGIYVEGFNDESDLNLGSNERLIGIRHFFGAGGMSLSPSTLYPDPYGYYKIRIIEPTISKPPTNVLHTSPQ
ncbi:MAG TPA: hypothetical protein PKL13_00670 [bacterium]|nr:hypothetical protein [bacterium]